MQGLPARGAAVRELDLALPPGRMPAARGLRPLKRWTYVGVYGPDLMLCAGDARVGPLPMRWWAVALPDGTLHERSGPGRGGLEVSPHHVAIESPGVTIAIEVGDGEAVETASPSGGSYIWTRKRAGVSARGTVEVAGRRFDVQAGAVVDESAGYHERHTRWMWSAGVGRAADGRGVGWNLVTGIHDSPADSERTVWVDGEPRELEPLAFAPDLSSVGGLRFSEWSAREDHTNLLLFRSDYRQPFGTFAGQLPGGIELAEGYGVMEAHDVRW